MAALASESARRTLALRGPADDPSAEIVRALGAAGHAIAHTGAARAFLFAPGTLPEGAGAVLRAAGFTVQVAGDCTGVGYIEGAIRGASRAVLGEEAIPLV